MNITDLEEVRAAVRPTTRIIYAETIANPTTAVADLRGLSEIAHESGALLVIDSTLAPPVICRPWSTARTWLSTPRPSTSAGTPTSPAAWSPGASS